MSLKIQISQKEYSAHVITYDRRAKVGLCHLESSYQFLQFDFTFGIFQNCTHMCASANRKKSPHSYDWDMPIAFNFNKRFPNSNTYPTLYSTMYMLCDIDSLSSKLFLKFVYFEKATKFEKNLPLRIWCYSVKSNFIWKIFFKFCSLLRISEL